VSKGIAATSDAIGQPRTATARKRLVLFGAGSLGSAFLQALAATPSAGQLVGLVTGHHGHLVVRDGMEPDQASEQLLGAGSERSEGPPDINAILDEAAPDILVECIPQNVRSGEPALSILRAAVDRGIHVVTANKTPIAMGYRDLCYRGSKTGATIRFEATLLDGLPLFAWMAAAGRGPVRRVRGVFNGTSSLVLESVESGSTRSRGLARAQAMGIAEFDPVLDLDGWDSAAKTALVANVWMSGSLRVIDVVRTGCDTLKDSRIIEAAKAGQRVRLISEIERGADGRVRASVEPGFLLPGDPLYALHGGLGGISVETDAGLHFSLLQHASGLDEAAKAMVLDCQAIAEGAPQA
jgi:homoserine dehydrogenase